ERQREEILEHADEPFGRAGRETEASDPIELREVRNRVAIAQLGSRDTEQAADVRVEAARLGTIEAERGLRLRPRPIEKPEQPMMKDVGEPAERRIVEVQLAAVRVLREMQRQRAVRPEQPERVRAEVARLAGSARIELGDGRRRKRERRLLA